jgi:hypothetical protein
MAAKIENPNSAKYSFPSWGYVAKDKCKESFGLDIANPSVNLLHIGEQKIGLVLIFLELPLPKNTKHNYGK